MAWDRSSRKNYSEKEMFLKGTEVEVCSKEEGFIGAWFVANILKSPSTSSSKTSKNSKKTVLVRYKTLYRDDDPKKLLEEEVDVSCIRPLPPASPKFQSFELFDVVDAYDSDGWWKGVVTKIEDATDETNNKFKKCTVVFENPPEKLQFEGKNLRFHYDWVHGSWQKPSKQRRMQGLNYSINMEVEVKLTEENSDEVWYPAVVLKEVGFDSFQVEYGKSSIGGLVKVIVDSFCMRLPPPKLVNHNYVFKENVDVLYDSAWRFGRITNVLSKAKCTVCLIHGKQGKIEKEFGYSEIRPHVDFKNGRWVSDSKDKQNTASGQKLLGHANNNLGSSKVAFQRQRSNAWENNNAGKSPFTNPSKNSLQQSSSPDDVPILSPPSKKFRRENSADPLSSLASLGNLIPSKKLSENPEGSTRTSTHCSNHNVFQDNKPSAGNESFSWVKKADTLNIAYTQEQPRHAHNDGKIPHAANQLECSSAAKGHTKERASCTDSGKNPNQQLTGYSAIYSYIKCLQTEHKKAKKHKETSQKENGVEDVTMISTGQREMQPNVKSNLSLTTSEPMQTAEQDETMISLEELGILANDEVTELLVEKTGSLVASAMAASSNYLEKEVVSPVAETACGPFNDNQPPSLTFEGNSFCKVEEKQVLPFEKDSPLWKFFESQEIFQRMPQDPHFRPLADCKEVEREAAAIGKMACFAILVQKISKLEVDAARVVFDDFFEVLADLERHGFDVKAVVDRLNNLLSIRERKIQNKNQSKAIQGQMADCSDKNNRAQEDVDASDTKIKELQSNEFEVAEKVKELEEQLRHFKSKLLEAKEQVVQAKVKQASDMLVKEKIDTEMTELQGKYNDLLAAISNDDLDFDAVASALW